VFRKDMFEHIINYLQDNWVQLVLKIFWAIGIFVVAYIFNKWIVNKVKNKIKNSGMNLNTNQYTEKMANMIGSIIYVVMMIVTIFIVFAFLGFEVALILWWLSIAVGFAMETTIKNMISGLFILTNNKLKLWDFVEILWAFQLRGVIEEVGLRHTTIRTIDKRKVLIPNWRLSDTPIKTLKSEDIIRSELDIHVPRHVNLDQVKNLLISTINTHEFILNKEYTSSIITGFDKNGFSLKSFFYYNPQRGKSAFVLNSEIRIVLHKVFKKYGIKAPYEGEVVCVE